VCRLQEGQNVSGHEAVLRLTTYLVSLESEAYLTDDQSRKIVRLWQGLDDVDKQRVTYVPRFQPKLVSGRFPRTMSRRLVPGIESVRRAFIGPGTPAQKPSLSPIVESVCMEVVHKYRRSTTVHTAKGRLCVPKWTKVIDGFQHQPPHSASVVRNLPFQTC